MNALWVELSAWGDFSALAGCASFAENTYMM
jgi:hypothetical protein